MTYRCCWLVVGSNRTKYYTVFVLLELVAVNSIFCQCYRDMIAKDFICTWSRLVFLFISLLIDPLLQTGYSVNGDDQRLPVEGVLLMSQYRLTSFYIKANVRALKCSTTC